MKLGLNLSFATKRWLEPEIAASMIKDDFGIDLVQFTWDLIDPWWPAEKRDILAGEWRDAFREKGIRIESNFGGLASYTYAQLLAPSQMQREISLEFFMRAIDLTAALGCDTVGTPVGGMSNKEAYDPVLRQRRYEDVLESLKKLASYGNSKGMKKIVIEATPLITEFPHSPEASLKMMQDLDGVTEIPIRLLVDWGHALFQPLLKEEADMKLWMKVCRPYLDSIHIQQTDGMLDRHWDFDQNGLVTPQLIKEVTEECGLEDVIQYLELVPAFEAFDDDVYKQTKASIEILKAI